MTRNPLILSASLLATSFAYRLFIAWLRRKLRAKYTALYDLECLGSPRRYKEKVKGTAVIAGGSLAGLLTARVCADHFTDVLIVDPEAFRSESGKNPKEYLKKIQHEPRPRTPQYGLLHTYHTFTPMALRKMFPDFDEQLMAVNGRIAGKPNLHTAGQLIPNPNVPGLRTMALSRDVYEPLLRSLVFSRYPNVKPITGTVTAVHSENWEHLDSVSVQNSESGTMKYGAALVIDCSGRSTSGYRWFKNSPIDTKPEDTPSDCLPFSDLPISYDPKVTSTTCEYTIPVDFLDAIACPVDRSCLQLYVNMVAYGQGTRAIMILLREHTRLQIALVRYGDMEKVSSIASLRTYLLNIELNEPFPEWIHSMLDALEEGQYPETYSRCRVPPVTYIRYSRASKLPSNFVAVGDSVLVINAATAQGCTKACIDAVTLNALLESKLEMDAQENTFIPSDFSKTFFQTQQYRTGRLWDEGRAIDYGYETTILAKGETNSFGESRRAFIHKVFPLLIAGDQKITETFWRVAAFVEAPAELLFPSVMVRIWWMSLKLRWY